MPKDPKEAPERRGEKGGPCPACKLYYDIEVPTVARKSKKTGELYFGCPNYGPPYYCTFTGCRSH